MDKKKFYGSLASRIVLILTILIVLPLFLYGGLMWYRDWRIKLNAVAGELELVGNGAREIFEIWSQVECDRLSQIAGIRRKKDLSEYLGELSTIFVWERSRIVEASLPDMVGSADFFSSYLQEGFDRGALRFIGANPFTKKEEIFVVKRIGKQVWGLSVDKAYWAKILGKFQKSGDPFEFSFVNEEGSLRLTQREISDKTVVLNLSELEMKGDKKFRFFEAQDLKGKDLALRVSIPNATFDIQVIVPAQEIKKYQGGELWPHLLMLILLFLSIGGMGTWWLIKRMAFPLGSLSDVMKGVSERLYDQRYKPDPFGFEINVLGDRFNQMLDSLLHNMERANQERIAREILTHELQIGREIQLKLLPKALPQFPHVQMGRRFISAKEVSGDFYDLYVQDDTHMFFAIADGSDKGVSACLYSLMVRSMLRSYTAEKEELTEIVLNTNNLFCLDTTDTGNFVTAWMGIYDFENRTLKYTSAGHFPAILIHPNGEIEELMTQGIALGVEEIEEVQVKSKTLSKGSCLFLYTDGVVEAQNEKGELFGKVRLVEILKTSHALGPQDLIDKLVDEISQFTGQAPQSDDLTILSLKTLD